MGKLRSIAAGPISRYADARHLHLRPPSTDTLPASRVKRETEKMPSNLVLAYRATDYVAFSDGRTFSIRVGRHSLVVDGLLTRMRTRSGAFITAWNPFSKRQSAGVNAHLDRELKACLSARGVAFLVGEGRGQVGEWPPEPSILAFGMSRAQAASIGRRYRQNAIVYVPLGRPAELVMLRWLG
jgi:uncharacterized protein DUF3293